MIGKFIIWFIKMGSRIARVFFAFALLQVVAEGQRRQTNSRGMHVSDPLLGLASIRSRPSSRRPPPPYGYYPGITIGDVRRPIPTTFKDVYGML